MADLSQHYGVIKSPLFTEKGTYQQERFNSYSFEVDAAANKVQIRKAIEALFEVSVVRVNVQNVRGKMRRVGQSQGLTSNWKKAIITLKEGQAIQLM